jgi:hypothetical protein
MKQLKRRGSVLVEYLLLAASSLAMASAAAVAIQEVHAQMLEQLRQYLAP